MRRTYRSKKDTGGALDHRDVIQALDEKTSTFNAFYIQNIKQTKRELSCLGSSNHFGAAANKVRKRKYVKRIVKDPEPSVRESMSTSALASAFLTPDKSIRVNKPQDLFDQLFNSSSHQNESPINKSNFNKFQFRKDGKTYNRRKLSKIKKFNCSSTDSCNSDKENSNEDINKAEDISDIRMHELLIEKEQQSSPKYFDESINKIVNNMSLLNNIKYSSSIGANNKSSSDNKLCINFNSPILSKSPLCSTPFKEKYRGKSIYKFSPIGLNKNDESPNYLTILEENNDSVVMLDQKSESVNEQPSPIIHLSIKLERSKKISNTKCNNVSINCEPPIDTTPLQDEKSSVKQSSKDMTSIEISDFQTTEVEPLLGFSVTKLTDIPKINLVELSMSETGCVKVNEEQELNVEDNSQNNNFMLETSKSSNMSCLREISNKNNDNEEIDSDSTYDTCNSEQVSYFEKLDDVKVPIVEIEKLNDSIFYKYYNQMKANDSEEMSDCNSCNSIDSDDYASIEESQSLNNDSVKSIDKENYMENTSEADDYNYTSDVIEHSIKSNDDIDTKNNDEDRCISFVTTRRRNDITNKSILLGFNDSITSTSSSDCNKTVLSINNENRLKNNLMQELDEIDSDCNYDTEESNATSSKSAGSSLEDRNDSTEEIARMSRITTRKSSKLPRESNNISQTTANSTIETEIKPPIVLQPGKKWERSLSIYKRMTLMTDQFDYSILDEDQLHTKGRKYRQSVISTMEMQEFKGSLHNESIISRRSTFVSKPCRSTIRIIKEPNSSRLSISTNSLSEDFKGFLAEDCDDTIVELSKLSIADSEHEVTVLEKFHETSNRATPARDYVLRRCNQTDTILFDECYPDAVLKNCRKIGEGVYGEVFLWRARDGRARVMKIVPIAGTTKVNGEHQKDFQEIISEIVIAMELSALRAPIDEIQREFDEGKNIDALDLHSVENATDIFNEVLAVRCVYGAYPSRLLDLWELYDECNGSENDNPAILPVDQQYIVLELANAGQDLESFEFNNAEQAHALFLQVAFGLAVGEEAFQFEHRDLHWGNVLIAPTDQKFATFVLRGRAHRVSRCGVSATIIDYSLSRLSLPLAGECAALYNDLAADEGLFDAVGDYQFQVYRLMRDKLGNDWKNFEPYTNILWLHYTVDKMITALRYKRTNTKIHKHYIAKLKGIKNRILNYGSAAQFVLTDNEF